MEIQTKYNYNDKVFFLHNNKVIEGNIHRIIISVENNTEIKYRVRYDSYKFKCLDEVKAFSTKQELLDSL